MPPLLPGDTVSLPTGTAGLSCSPGRSPSLTSGKATSGSEVLWFSENDGCPSEPQFPLCTCGVLLASPASSPHVSSLLLRSPVQHAMAQQGSLFLVRDVKDWQLSVNRGVNCARFAWFFTGHGRSWWSTFIPLSFCVC